MLARISHDRKGENTRFVPNENTSIIVQKEKYGGRIKKLLREYCEISTIQGLKYAVKDISLTERLWWIAVLLLSLAGCSIMIYQVFDKWITTPVLVSLATQETPIYEIPFPAITICPETKLSYDCMNYDKILDDGEPITNTSLRRIQYLEKMMMPLCEKSEIEDDPKKLETLIGESLDDYANFLRKCAVIDLNAHAYCEWIGNEVNCKKILTPILTDEGLCYSFNMFDVRDIYSDIKMKYYREGVRKLDWYPGLNFPEHKLDETYPRRVFLDGEKHSLFVVIFTLKSEINYACREIALQGIKASVHMPATMPRPSQLSFTVGLNHLTTIALKPTLTKITDSVKNYDSHMRNCYFNHEKKLKYFKIYTQENCNLECWTNYTIQHCGCTDFYMPRDNKTNICNMSKRTCVKRAKVIYPRNVLQEHLGTSNNEISASECDCLPLCSDLRYNSEVVSGHWQFYDPADEIFDEVHDVMDQYYMSALRVYFKDTFFLPIEKSELYGLIDFLANIGGILGLFTGFTLFSIAEIIYFISIKLIENNRKYGHWYEEEVR